MKPRVDTAPIHRGERRSAVSRWLAELLATVTKWWRETSTVRENLPATRCTGGDAGALYCFKARLHKRTADRVRLSARLSVSLGENYIRDLLDYTNIRE